MAILAASFVADLGPLNPAGAAVTPGLLLFIAVENAVLIVLVEITSAIMRRHAAMTE